MKRKSLYLLGLLTSVFALQSCIDSAYDLDDIDKTIGNKIDLTLPASSTGDIQLKSLMDLKEDGVVQFIKGPNGNSIFAVIQDGEAKIDSISIDTINLNPNLGEINTMVNLAELGNASAAPKRKVKIKVPLQSLFGGDIELDLPEATYSYPIKDSTAYYCIDENDPNARKKIESKDIVSIKKVTFEENTTLSLKMNIEGFPNWLPYVTLENLTLQCPPDMIIKQCTFAGREITPIDGKYPLTNKSNSHVSFSEPIELKLELGGVQTGDNFNFNSENQEVSISGLFEVTGTFRISTEDIDTDALYEYFNTISEEQVTEVYQTMSILPILPNQLTFKGIADLGDGITLKEFYGELQHEVGEISPIQLNDLPDFLSDDDVVLDLDNPIILLKASQELPTSVSTSVTLTANNGAAPVIVNPLTIRGNGETNYFYIADKEVTNTDILPEEYRKAEHIQPSGSISGLIQKIPEEIKVDIAPITLDASTEGINLLQDYNVDVAYQVYAPLTLGPNFQLVYRDTEKGWSEDLEDFEDINVSEITLTAQVESNLPAEATLSVKPIDASEELITDQMEIKDIIIAANTTSRITINLKAKGKYTLNDIITGRNGARKLDGVKYEARINSVTKEGEDPLSLPEDAYIKLKDIRVSIKGDVTYDAN